MVNQKVPVAFLFQLLIDWTVILDRSWLSVNSLVLWVVLSHHVYTLVRLFRHISILHWFSISDVRLVSRVIKLWHRRTQWALWVWFILSGSFLFLVKEIPLLDFIFYSQDSILHFLLFTAFLRWNSFLSLVRWLILFSSLCFGYSVHLEHMLSLLFM